MPLITAAHVAADEIDMFPQSGGGFCASGKFLVG